MSTKSVAFFACERRTVALDRQHVVATGELDVATGPRLADALRAAQAAASHVVLDLEGMTFIDMSGVRVLLAAAEDARAAAGTFEIVHATAAVDRMLALTGAHRTLDEVSLPPAKGAGDGARAASPLWARNRRSPLPSSPSAASSAG